MNHHQRIFGLFLLLFIILSTACAPVKTVEVWKDPNHVSPMQKTLVIAVTQNDIIRHQFENVLVNRLATKGVEAIASHKVLPQKTADLDRETVVAKVEELGVMNVLVARSIKKTEITNHQLGGPFFAPSAAYVDGWYTFYTGSMVYPAREYDTDYVTVAANLFALGNKKPVWSSISQVRVRDSRQKAVNECVPILVQQLEVSRLVKSSQ